MTKYKSRASISLIGAIVATAICEASPVSSDEAAQAVQNWIGCRAQLGCRIGAVATGVRTCSPTNGVTFHVVTLSGGGFVVVSSDTEIEPVLAFSESDDLVESEGNPLWTLLRRGLSARGERRRQFAVSAASSSATVVRSAAVAKWARLLPAKSTNGTLRLSHAASGKATLSDVRVAPLIQTKWSQEQDAYYSNQGNPCYNYYTPYNYPCGCVATAAAQLMRYHRFPTASVTPGTYACGVEVGKDWIDAHSYYPIYEDCRLTMQGGYYDWNSMPLVPADGTTLAQRKAIGKLTSDVGIACLTYYGDGGSSAADYMLSRCLPERFGYANAVAACDGYALQMSAVSKALVSNLDAKLPVVLGLYGYYGGHAVVADGYGYSLSTLYAHINLGWAGKNDAWYALPDVTDDFNAIDTMVYNIYPTGVANGVICSGRVLSSSGVPIAGATVSASGAASASVMSDAKGIYAFILEPGTYAISSGDASRSVTLEANVGTVVTDEGTYYASPRAKVNNVCDFDLTVSGEPEPQPEPSTDPSVAVECALLEGVTLTVGQAVSFPLEFECTACSIKSVKATGLPTGLKLLSGKKAAPYDYLIAGTPTKATSKPYAVKLTVQAKAESSSVKMQAQVFTGEVTVSPLAAWATGTFVGVAEIDDAVGAFTMTTKATGAITGKITLGKKSHAFKATGFLEVTDAGCTVEVTPAKLDTLTFDIVPAVFGSGLVGVITNGGVTASQSIWQQKEYKKLLTKYTSPDKSLSWTAAGKVTWSTTIDGKKVKLTSTLMPVAYEDGVLSFSAYFVSGQTVVRLDVRRSDDAQNAPECEFVDLAEDSEGE